MKLENLRKIAAARTSGVWRLKDAYVSLYDEEAVEEWRGEIVSSAGYSVSDPLDHDDALFIVAFANHCEALLAVVEAVKQGDTREAMRQALAALEAVE